MPLHKENKCYIFHLQSKSMQLNSQLAMATHIRLLVVRPPAIEEHAAEFAACYCYSHQAVSREAGIHSVFSAKKTNSLRVSPPHLWLTHVAPTTTATTTQLRRRRALSSSNTTSRSARRSQWGRICICSRCGGLQAGPVGSSCCRSRCTASGTGAHIHWARSGSSGRPSGFRRITSLPLGHRSYKFLRESWADALRDIT